MALARKLVHELMVVSPVMLILGIAVSARTRVDDFEPIGYGTDLQQRLTAYVVPVREVSKLSHAQRSKRHPDRVRKVAAYWVELGKRGTLQPLPPSDSSDSLREGVKAQVFRSVDYLAKELLHLSDADIRAGKHDLAADDLLLGLELLAILKYSDLYAVGLSSLRQRQMLASLGSISGTISAKKATEAGRRLAELERGGSSLGRLVAQARRQFVEGSRRAGIERQSIEEVDRFVLVGNVVRRSNPSEAETKAVDRLLLAAADDKEVPPYFSEIRFAWHGNRSMRAALKETFELLARR